MTNAGTSGRDADECTQSALQGRQQEWQGACLALLTFAGVLAASLLLQ